MGDEQPEPKAYLKRFVDILTIERDNTRVLEPAKR
jgi:hypothetical protein